MEQATNDLRLDRTKLEKAERELETAKLELAESKTNLKTAETNRNAQEFQSDKWKFFNEEVSRCSAMVTSAEAMVTAMVTSTGAMALKLTPAHGTYPLPPPHTRITHNPALLTVFPFPFTTPSLSLLPPLRSHSSLASNRLV